VIIAKRDETVFNIIPRVLRLQSTQSMIHFQQVCLNWVLSDAFEQELSFHFQFNFTLLNRQRLDLFAWRVRLSRLLVGFRTHL